MSGRKKYTAAQGRDPIDVHIGERIRHRRVMLNLTQTMIARRLGMSFQSVQKYESGENRVATSTLMQIGEILEVPLEYFVEGLSEKRGTSRTAAEREWLALHAVKPLSALPPEVRSEFITLFRVLMRTMRKR
jgi:transcriptional regulator with XRE-family HTH domain